MFSKQEQKSALVATNFLFVSYTFCRLFVVHALMFSEYINLPLIVNTISFN